MSNTLFVAWRSPGPQGVWGPVGRIQGGDNPYHFCYTRGARMVEGFRPFPEMPDLEQIYVADELFPVFANRLLPQSRPEFQSFLMWSGFTVGELPDPIAILSVTEGHRETDSIEVFPCPVPDADGCYMNKFFLHGVRHVEPDALNRIHALKPDERVILMPELSNPYDANAVAVYTQDRRHKVGYVPRYLAREVAALNVECGPEIVSLFIQRINRDAPLQQRVLCRMHACWPQTFQPCGSEEFQPIPSQMTVLAAIG